MPEKAQWRQLKPGAPIIKNLQIISESLQCLITESLKRDVASITAMAKHLKERPEIDKQLKRSQ